MLFQELKDFLDEKVLLYNQPDFIDKDPISIPHQFSLKEDIEIAGFLVATIAWGRRDLILKSANHLIRLMEYSPYDFLTEASAKEWECLAGFYYRTFSAIDCLYFVKALSRIYSDFGGLEEVFKVGYKQGGIKESLVHFREVFFSYRPPERTFKHVANIEKGASAKRLNMFLRWMVRNDKSGVDFGMWKHISPRDLLLPLDLHSGNIARKLGLLKRKQNDFKAVLEVTTALQQFDVNDPIKYDFALFGLGVNEAF